jgi:hypothetical protein
MNKLPPPIVLADYDITKVNNDKELCDKLRDPLFRICNLYKIRDADGKDVQFTPNGPQRIVLHAIYVLGWNRLLIPKARQLGFSTLFAIICLDETLFSDGKQASIVDQTQSDASEKLNKVRFAWERLPNKIREDAVVNNGKEIAWANGSRVCGGMNARGGTNQVLHISEWGPIAFEDPARSQEIATGAIPSASGTNAKIFCESTHMGGKGGDWYDMIKQALETPEEFRTSKDFRVMFFPWWMEKRYRIKGDIKMIGSDTMKYFEQLKDKHGIVLDDEQKMFYFKESQRLKRNMLREFPSVIEECWAAPTPGMIYAQEIDKARSQGRINPNVLYIDSYPVYTAFDIGAPENQKVWLFQVIGDKIKLLEALSGGDECKMPAHWAKLLKKKDYNYGGHFLPHDGELLWRQQLQEAGLSGVVCVPRQGSVWDGVNDVIEGLARCEINSILCENGLNALEAYHSKLERDGNSVRDVPVHDWASHFCDALSIAFQAMRRGMLIDRSGIKPMGFSQGNYRSRIGVTTERPKAFSRISVRR